MNRPEMPYVPDFTETSTAIEQTKVLNEDGLTIKEFSEKTNLDVERSTIEFVRQILEENPYLSDIEVVLVSPEDVPNTGGFFRRVEKDENTFIPTIFIVAENEAHMQRLKATREASARRVAEMLKIDFAQLTPSLLRQFIIAHEIGHASDYVKNYVNNPELTGLEVVDEWNLHYEANLFTLPVPGFDPVDLREELGFYASLADFLQDYPALTGVITKQNIQSKEDLLNMQENAYRASTYESYADNFATNFLKNNADKLEIKELTKID